MRRLLSFVAVALMICTATTIKAQMKVDEDAINRKIAKSDADIQNPKKNVKPAVWIERGKVFTEAADAPTNGVFATMDSTALALMFGEKAKITKEVAGETYKVIEYPYFDVYMQNGIVKFWDTKKEIYPGAIDKASEAYAKAYEIDKAAKVKDGYLAIGNFHKQNAGNYFSLQNFPKAAKAFRQAYDAQMHPTVNFIDTAAIFNAGFLYTVALDYANGIDNLKKALEYQYENDGDIYYYMFHCYYGLKDNANARDILLKGLARYPKNNRIVEGLLGLYSSGGGDPKEIVPIVEKAIEDDPKNPELWGGLGRIYDKLGDPEKSIQAFAKAAELTPNDFSANFNLGLLYVKRGDMMSQELNKKQFTSQKEYDAAYAIVLDAYQASIDPLEKALAAQPNDPATIELLKGVTFRLRDRDGIMEKYDKYNEMFKALQ